MIASSLSREICKICYHPNRVGFSVPDETWKTIISEKFVELVVCMDHPTRLGDKKGVCCGREIDFFSKLLHPQQRFLYCGLTTLKAKRPLTHKVAILPIDDVGSFGSWAKPV